MWKTTYKLVLCRTWGASLPKKTSKALAKHEVGAQMKKNQKACTTTTMCNGGASAQKKQPKTQGRTGVGCTSAIAKLVAYATATTTTTTTPPHHHHIATPAHNTQQDMSNQMSLTKVVVVFCPCGAAGDHRAYYSTTCTQTRGNKKLGKEFSSNMLLK
jgi:hypothetical protein